MYVYIYIYILGYPFGHFLFFWIFVASCLTSPGHRSTFDFKKIPGSSALDWGTIGRSFFLECSFQPLGCSFQPFFASFFFGWWGRVDSFRWRVLLPATVRHFGGCSACAAPAAAAARLLLPWPAAPAPLLLEALHHRRLSYLVWFRVYIKLLLQTDR